MTVEDFRNLGQGIQAILLSTGVLLAGGWAIYRFRSLLSVQKAKADLAKANAEVDRGKAELEQVRRELDAHPSVSVQVEPSLVDLPRDGDFCIRVNLRLRNSGNTPEFVDWSESTIKGAIVERIVDGRLKLGTPIPGVFGRIAGKEIGKQLWPGETSILAVLIPIEQHGLYLIHVVIRASAQSVETLQAALSRPSRPGTTFEYGTSVYFDTRKSETSPTGEPGGQDAD